MSKDNSNGFPNMRVSISEEEHSSKSFVKKVKSRVSGLLPSSLSKWFGSEGTKKAVVRLRDEDDDDQQSQQPPAKRAKIPSLNPINSFTPSKVFLPPQPTHSLFIPDDNVAGPSSDCNELYNGDDKNSESEESSSGYSLHVKGSSIKNNKDPYDVVNVINANQLFSSSNFGHNRSLFSDKSISFHANTSLSSRRPSFNTSTFGSPTFVDRTLSTQRIMSSPFYNGCTTYGGAAAHSKPKTPKVQVKPVNERTQNVNHSTTLSLTARRILNTLEQYATDVNKIPHPMSDKKTISVKYSGATPYVVREHRVPSAELQVPAVPDLLKMKLKQRLQDSTVAVRHIASTSKNAQDEYKTSKHTNKIKNKITSVRQKANDELVPKTNLPEVPLPITTLPKFDLSWPLLNTSKPVTVPCKDISKTNLPEAVKPTETPLTLLNAKSLDKSSFSPQLLEFKFAEPLVMSQNIKSVIAINDFKFSEPEIFNKRKSTDGLRLELKNDTISDKPFEQLTDLTKFKGDDLSKFKPANDTWECSVCLLRNLRDKTQCVACEALKLTDAINSKPSFGSEFKMKDDKWECKSCLVRNINNDIICVACSTPKQKLNGPINTMFGDKFKPPSGTWECSICMIRNKNELENCAACETRKSGFTSEPAQSLDAFKMKTNQWECTVCMVRNSVDKTKCAACETPKQNTSQTEIKTAPSFTFGILPNTKTTAAGFKFAASESKPDDSNVNAPSPQFVFGAKAVVTQTQASITPSFSFGFKPTSANILETKTPQDSEQNEVTADSQSKILSTKNKLFVSSATAFTPPEKTPNESLALPSAFKFNSTQISEPTKEALSLFKFGENSVAPLVNNESKHPVVTPQAVFKANTGTPPVSKLFFNGPEKVDVPIIDPAVAQTKPVVSKTNNFSFGAPCNLSGFSFGQKTIVNEKPANFKFGSVSGGGLNLTSNIGTSPTPAFSFALAKEEPSSFQATAQPVANIFSTEGTIQPVAPVQNGLFNFGAAPLNTSEFNFSGQQQVMSADTPTTNIFSFGAKPSAPTTSGGFNFGTTPNLTFNSDSKPTFNFTQGATPPTFSAQPTANSESFPHRRKMRAVRRNPQR